MSKTLNLEGLGAMTNLIGMAKRNPVISEVLTRKSTLTPCLIANISYSI